MFGCLTYASIHENDIGKMDKKSEKCIFIGYSNESKKYQLYNPETKKLIIRLGFFMSQATGIGMRVL